MSRSIGIASAQLIGARVAGQTTYIPTHTKNGKEMRARCIIPVYVNLNNKGEGPGKSNRFSLVAFGKLADSAAKSLPKGKALDCICTPSSYQGRVYDPNGNMVLDATGQPLMIEKTSFIIQRPIYGEESQKEIDLEIQTGKRPVNWSNTQHPDHQAWLTILQARQAAQYTGGTTFGFSRVVIPSGPGIALMNKAPVNYNQSTQNFQAGNTYQTPANPATPNTDPQMLAQVVAQVLKGVTPIPTRTINPETNTSIGVF